MREIEPSSIINDDTKFWESSDQPFCHAFDKPPSPGSLAAFKNVPFVHVMYKDRSIKIYIECISTQINKIFSECVCLREGGGGKDHNYGI
jgi:hypothetical protein